MLPSFLVDSYKQYKADTDSIATWLAATAKQCGYSADLLENKTSTPQHAPRLKGKARKLARDETKQGKTPQTTNAPPSAKYVIAVKDFISLADYVAKSTKPLVKVPVSFVSTIDRAITVRKRSNAWFYGRNDKDNAGDDMKADDKHLYFVGILEKVRELLKPRMPTELLKDPLTQPPEDTSVPPDAAGGNIANLFENLHVEEPSDSFQNASVFTPTTAIQRPTVATEAQYEAETMHDLQELYLAVHCLFNDLNNIRRFLHQVWLGYKDEVFDLVAALITTNTAIDLARSIEEDSLGAFPREGNFEKHINVLYGIQCALREGDGNTRERPSDDMNFKMYDVAEELFFSTYMFLSAFNNIVEPKTIPSYKPGFYGTYDASSDRSQKSAREKFLEDKIILMEILPDFALLALGTETYPAEDEITRGIREMIHKNKISMWLVFSIQIFLDIHHILREEVGRGYVDLCRAAKYIEASLESNFEFHQSLRIENWPPSNDIGLRQILARINDWVKTDCVKVAMQNLVSSILSHPRALPKRG